MKFLGASRLRRGTGSSKRMPSFGRKLVKEAVKLRNANTNGVKSELNHAGFSMGTSFGAQAEMAFA